MKMHRISANSKNWTEAMQRSRTNLSHWSTCLNNFAACWSLCRLFSESLWFRSNSWRTHK